MKTIFLTAAILLSLSANAITVVAGNEVVISICQEKDYKKVETNQVPADILKQASSRYSGYALTEAYASEDGEYKLVLSKDGKTVKAYFKSTGEFIKEEAK